MNIPQILFAVLILYIIISSFYFFTKKSSEINYAPFENIWNKYDEYGVQNRIKVLDLIYNFLEFTYTIHVSLIPVFGTLLGLVRHNSLIPWNDNVSVMISLEDMMQIKANKDLLSTYSLELIEENGYKICRTNDSLISGTELKWPFINLVVYTEKQTENTIAVNDIILEKGIVFPLSEAVYYNPDISYEFKFYMPHNPRAILDIIYNEDWINTCISSTSSNKIDKNYRNKSQKIECSKIQDYIDFEDLFDNTWVINLDKSTDRWDSCRKQLNNIDLYPKRWSATYGKDPKHIKRAKNIRSNLPFLKKIFWFMSPGRFGCFESHLNLWKHLKQKGVRNALIMEDDFLLHPNFNKDSIIDVVRSSKGFDIIFVGYCFADHKHRFPSITIKGTAMCLHAYIVNLDSLGKLIEKAENNRNIPIDWVTKDFCKENLCFLTKDIDVYGGSSNGLIKQGNGIQSEITAKYTKPF